MTLFEFRNHFDFELLDLYDQRERKSIFQRIVKQRLELDGADILLSKLSIIGNADQEALFADVSALKEGEPVQYVLGKTSFFGLDILCNPSALIPRPETEELVAWVVGDHNHGLMNVLDIGTGTGCIPLALKNVRNHWTLSGLDVSVDALSLAAENGKALKLAVNWIQHDILSSDFKGAFPEAFDLIVSNPPYIPMSEKTEMPELVIEYEPDIALFVPDDDPFVFYKRIASFAKQNLKPDGFIYLEIHEDSAVEMIALLKEYGFNNLFMKKDLQGKNRMIKAQMLNL